MTRSNSKPINKPQNWKLGILAGVFFTSAGAGTVGSALATTSWVNNPQCRGENVPMTHYGVQDCQTQRNLQLSGGLATVSGYSLATASALAGRSLQRRGSIDVNEVRIFQGL